MTYAVPTGSRTIRFRHDPMGRLMRLTGPAGLSDSTGLFYNRESLLDSLRLPSGLKQRFTYTPTHQPLAQTWSSAAPNAAFRREREYNPFGRVTRIVAFQ